MNLETRLDERLWKAVEATYSNRNFTSAILDAIYFLSDIIREKTGLQSDGVALVGQAFGGKNPPLKVTKLQSESDLSVQNGVEQLLRGLFQAIRNPRSHEKHIDSQEEADTLILFVNYLVGVIDKSRSPFSKVDFLKRVFDKSFVEKQRYAQLLVEEIPARKRLEVMLDVIRDKEQGAGKALALFVSALLSKLTDDERTEVYRAVSDELKVTESDDTIRTTLAIFPSDIQLHLEEPARLRMENRLIRSIAEGRLTLKTGDCLSGALGTWAMGRCQFFLLKDDLLSTIVRKLQSTDWREHAYVFKFFWSEFTDLEKPTSPRIVQTIKRQLKAGNSLFRDRLSNDQLFGGSKWYDPFKAEMEAFKEADSTPDSTYSDLPF